MKVIYKLWFISLLLILSNNIKAQSFFDKYRVEYSQQTYVELTNPAYPFFTKENWKDSSYKWSAWQEKLDDKFSFDINNEKMNFFDYDISLFTVTFYGDTNGFSTRPVAANTKEYSNVIPYQTKVSATIDSSTAEKIFILEFKQLGLTDSTWKTKGYLNMQYWYYANGDFEVRYGDCLIPKELWRVKKHYTGEGNYKLQFVFKSSGTYYLYLYGKYNKPNIYVSKQIKFAPESNNLDNLMRDSALSQVPPSGSVYRFTTRPVGVEELYKKTIKNITVYPNPSAGIFILNGLASNLKYYVQVCDGTGKKLFDTTLYQQQNAINLQALENGMYYIQISNDEGTISKKIIVAH